MTRREMLKALGYFLFGMAGAVLAYAGTVVILLAF